MNLERLIMAAGCLWVVLWLSGIGALLYFLIRFLIAHS